MPFDAAELERARALAQAPAEASPADVATLPDALGLAVLEAAVRARALPLAEALSESDRKPLAKAAKKALYRLRSAGVAVPERKPSSPPGSADAAATHSTGPAGEEPLPSLASAITGNGERALIVGRPLRGRVETLQWVVADEHGVVHLGINVISRGQYRKMLREAQRPGAASAVEIPLDEARALLADAVGQNLRSRTPFPEGMETALRHLAIAPAETPLELPAPLEDDQGTAARGASLHAQPELAQWLPAVEAIRSFAVKVQEIAASPLYVDETQRAEALRRAVHTNAEDYFTEDVARLYARRLWRMADLFERTGRDEPASIARAEARRLFHRAEGLFSPFAVAMFEKILTLSAPGAMPMPPVPRPPGAGAPAQSAAPSPGQAAGATTEEKRSPGGLILP